MPVTRVVFYREADGSVPFIEWFASLPEKVQDKCRTRIERLGSLGYELRRPEADYLEAGILELRASYQGIHYRILYFLSGQLTAVISHGLLKEKEVPPKEIKKALRRKRNFERNSGKHTHREPIA